MMDYEPITKGLREQMAHTTMAGRPMVETGRVVFDSYCDNIDAIHRSLEQENERLRDASERGDDWIKLPVDADGVPIHIGDTLEWSDGTTFEVIGIGDGALYYLDADADGHISIEWASTEQKRHAKPDTWENIISDAVKLGFTDPDNEHLADKLVARCEALCERTREE